MTIASQTSRISYTGDGSTTAFAVPFYFAANADLVVSVQDLSGNVTTKILGTDYTLSGATLAVGGTCTFTTAPVTNFKIAIYRVPEITQTTSYNNNDPFPAKSHELALDKTATIDQYLKTLIDRAILVAPTDNPPMMTLPPASVRALKNFTFDALGNPTVSTPIAGTTVSSALIPVVTAATLANARALLGVTDPSANRAAMKAIDTAVLTSTYLTEAGREGEFVWKTGNYAAQVTGDPQEGVYLKANAIATTAGAWVRVRTEGVYDVKWFGALGDNATDDYTAIQAAINLAQINLGGTILFSQGGYVCNTGLTITGTLIRLTGVGTKYCSVRSLTPNINLITISAARCSVTNLSIFNSVVSTVSSALVTLASGAVQCTLDDLDMVGGWFAIWGKAGAANCCIKNVVARATTGGAIVYTQGAGALIFDSCVFDHDWPSGGSTPPTSANNKGNWAAATSYALNDYVITAGKVIQCVQAGTSAGSAPSFVGVWYGTQVTDLGAKWQLANIDTAVAVQVDSASTYITFKDCDMTGSFTYGARTTNGLGTTPPDVIRFENVTIAGIILHGIHLVACKGVWIDGCEIQVNVGNNAFRSGVVVDTTATGDIMIRGTRVTNGFANGFYISNTSFGSVQLLGNQAFGLTVGANVVANTKDFVIQSNNFGSSSLWGNNTTGILIAAGTSDNYVILGNRLFGAGTKITDGGTGANKSVTGNV